MSSTHQQHVSSLMRPTVFRRRAMTIGSSFFSTPTNGRAPSELIHLLLVVLIISNWLGYGCSIPTCRFSPSPQLAHLTYFAILSLSFVSRFLLTVEVWLLLLFHPLGVRSSISHSFSCGTPWHREVHKPSLSKEPALQGSFEARGLGTGRKGNGEVHTGKPQG